MLRFVQKCGLAAAAAAIAGCASTSYVSSWKAPIDGPIQFDDERVAAVVVSADESIRRAGEDALAREISRRGAQGIPSYTVISGEGVKDKEAVKNTPGDEHRRRREFSRRAERRVGDGQAGAHPAICP